MRLIRHQIQRVDYTYSIYRDWMVLKATRFKWIQLLIISMFQVYLIVILLGYNRTRLLILICRLLGHKQHSSQIHGMSNYLNTPVKYQILLPKHIKLFLRISIILLWVLHYKTDDNFVYYIFTTYNITLSTMAYIKQGGECGVHTKIEYGLGRTSFMRSYVHEKLA